MQFRNILITTDCSGSAEEAVQPALALAAREQANVLLLHVLPSPFVSGREETTQANAEQRLRAVASQALVPVQILLAWGTPGAEICRVAKEHHIDLITLSTRGHTGMAHVAMGSVADFVIRHAPCAVLILRASLSLGTQSRHSRHQPQSNHG